MVQHDLSNTVLFDSLILCCDSDESAASAS